MNSIFWVLVIFPVFFMKYKYETPLAKGWSCAKIVFLQTIIRSSPTSHKYKVGLLTCVQHDCCPSQRVRCSNTIVFLKTSIRSREHPPRVTNREAGQATRSELAQLSVAAHHHHLASYSRQHLDSTSCTTPCCPPPPPNFLF